MTEEFKVTDGHYWYARMPDGRWSVFWWHPSQGDWHKFIAAFSTEDRAESYVMCENDCLHDEFALSDEKLEPPKQLPPPSRLPQVLEGKPLPPVRLSPNFASDLLSALPDLFAAHPDGVTSDLVMKQFGVKYSDVLDAMRWLHLSGAGHWVHIRGRPGNKKILLPPDAQVEDHVLSDRQERVFEVMRRHADQYGCITKPMKEIAAEANVSSGSIAQIVYALENKGFVMMAKPASRNGVSSAVYQIIRDADASPAEEEGHKNG